ncbi:vascular endothelial growth factor receptor 1 isoform X2 [Scaptodrosophila lebanonensis]|uniref:Vascular endothelial growth factor receptor 1 isoform X2 n=1 Tax=Drosophila lebanonensis TaxID=7225 RepID=A0A6J2U8V8_DROLE|nr:vascular endothelial growth factor receptor 1 isoform X2 [Scaptodrosophila lebanonensis]
MYSVQQYKMHRRCFSYSALLLMILISQIIICTPLPRPQNELEPWFEGAANCGGDGAPLITPCKDSIILDGGTDYTLRCEAPEPIIWWHVPNGRQDSTPFHNLDDPDRPFGVSLQLQNVHSEYVGAYYCVKLSDIPDTEIDIRESKFIELTNNNDATSIYVYVNDRNHLLGPTIAMVDVTQFDEVIIPCKPTMPDVVVQLSFNGETHSSDTFARYYERRGFTIEIRGVTDCGDYICRPKVPSEENELEETITTVVFSGNKHIDKAQSTISKPTIRSNSRGHAYVGDNFELSCELSARTEERYSIEWRPPTTANMNHINNTFASHFDDTQKNTTHKLGRKLLRVTNAGLSDSGFYNCTVTDPKGNVKIANYKMKIMEPNSSYLEMKEPSDHYKVRENANKTVQITVEFRGFPQPTLKWYKPDGSEIWETGGRFSITFKEGSTSTSTLLLRNAQLLDSGRYIVKGTNGIDFKQLEFNVSISSKPIVSLHDVYVEEGHEAALNCTVKSFPTALVTWVFTPCSTQPHWPSCDNRFSQTFNSSQRLYPGELSIEYIHELRFMPTQPGILSCIAANNIGGIAKANAHVFIADISENMTIYGLDEKDKIARGDPLSFTCAALAYHFRDNLVWYHNGELVQESNDLKIETNNTKYSYKKTLKIGAVRDEDRGTYECRAYYIKNDSAFETSETNVFVHEPKAPKWEDETLALNSKIERNIGEELALYCRSDAIPKANVRWYKDNVEVVQSKHIKISDDQSELLFRHLLPAHDGVYKCVVQNRLGIIESSTTVVIANMPRRSKTVVWIIIASFLGLISLCVYFCWRYRRERRRHLALKAAGLANFEEGAVEHINPALTLDEQADLLPYDRKFEFQREKLKLGKQLGAGAFGVVLKGEAEGIRSDEPVSTVAVKMVKRTADNEVVKALVSELKIMVHLGQHLNVVNLLGAVTKNIAKRELMVIVEYCRFGNVQNVLLRNRKYFINQISPTTNKIDPTIDTQRFSENYELHRDGGGGGNGVLKYANLSFKNHSYINQMNNNNYTNNHRRNSDNDPRSGTRAGRPGSAGYSYETRTDTCATEATMLTTIEDDDHVMSNNSIQPAWRSNYKPDSIEAMTVTTTDLVSWAFQVARGMDYLSSKKVLHGDLAARNILLCDDNVVKICDFGLARSMYRGDNYKKTGDARLPIKWLALESLSDHVFSTYTDVWSFGIVLWELFSLAKVPYPGIDPNQELYVKLKDGYRMEKPAFANDDLYEIMLECWRTNPESRPLFNELETRFAALLSEDVASHYMDLNDPYLRSNSEYMKNRPTDYLALMGSPDELAPAPPPYVNGHIVPEIRIDVPPDDNLQLSLENTTAIFSPTRPKGDTPTSQAADIPENSCTKTTETSFTFPDIRRDQPHSPTLANNIDSNAHKPLRKKNGLPTVDALDRPPEEIPMLHRASTSSGDQSPEQSRKFTQQSHPMPTPSPRHHIETKLNGEKEHYVNIKPPRKALANKPAGGGADAFSNPSYQALKTVSEQEERRY